MGKDNMKWGQRQKGAWPVGLAGLWGLCSLLGGKWKLVSFEQRSLVGWLTCVKDPSGWGQKQKDRLQRQLQQSRQRTNDVGLASGGCSGSREKRSNSLCNLDRICIHFYHNLRMFQYYVHLYLPLAVLFVPFCIKDQSVIMFLLPTGVSNLRPAGHMQLRMAVNAAQHNIVNFLKIWDFGGITCHNVFNMWPETILPLWSRDAKSLDTPVGISFCEGLLVALIFPLRMNLLFLTLVGKYLLWANEIHHSTLLQLPGLLQVSAWLLWP